MLEVTRIEADVYEQPTGRKLGRVWLDRSNIQFDCEPAGGLPLRMFRIIEGLECADDGQMDVLITADDGWQVEARVAAMPVARDCPGFLRIK